MSASVDAALRLGDWLRRLRDRAGLSQSQLAVDAGVVVRGYRDVERGRRLPGPRMLLGLEHALGLSPFERAHLRRLVAPGPPPEKCIPPDMLGRLFQSLGVPAIAIDHRWNIVGRTPGFEAVPGTATNVIEWLLSADGRSAVLDWPDEARLLIARYRGAQAWFPPSPRHDAAMAALCRQDPFTAGLWDGPDVAEDPTHRTIHLRSGALTSYLFRAGPTPALRIAVYSSP